MLFRHTRRRFGAPRTGGARLRVRTTPSATPSPPSSGRCPRLPPDPPPSESFVRERCRSGPPLKLEDALRFFDVMMAAQPPPSVYTFNFLLTAIARLGYHDRVVSLYKRMLRAWVGGDAFTRGIVVHCFCCHLGRPELGLGVLGDLMKRGCEPTRRTLTSLIKGLFAGGRASDATRVFERMPEMGCPRDVVVYAAFIKGLCETGNCRAALKLIQDMRMQGGLCKPDVIAYGTVIDGLQKRGALGDALKLFEDMVVGGVPPDVVTYNCIIHGYASSGRWHGALNCLGEMVKRGLSPTVVTLNTLMDSLGRRGRTQKARKLFDSMVVMGERPDLISYSILMQAYCLEGQTDKAEEVFQTMGSKGLQPDLKCYNILIDGFCKKGKLGEAVELFTEMEQKGLKPDLVAYSTILDGLLKAGRTEDANKLLDVKFMEMYHTTSEEDDGLWHSA
ncbi:hypothetical protein Taro_046109 [Colocasia esculenta]|uniref:Pentatricopeptide repeat-containing protein n=1 Tax=Colocasia esculenta TaxID=4460 RepID=A0A843X563_COLES|nr:hypothetical protein [Colocasia esculenta]